MNFNFMPFAATSTSSQASGGTAYMLIELLFLVAIFVVFYLLLIRPQKKREKETANMRNNVQVGDEITTVGGIVGRIVSIKDDTLVIESGADRNKIRVKKWAVQSCETVHDDK